MGTEPYEVIGLDENPNPKSGSTAKVVIGIILSLGILIVLIGLLTPTVRRARPAARRMHCSNNMRQIGLALMNYESTWGALPPSYTVDESGKPLHSWRTLILPFVEEVTLYKSIDLSKPWDDPVNKDKWKKTPEAYRCPSILLPDKGLTPYQAVVTENSAMQKMASHKSKEIADGPSNTLLIFESSIEDAVPWMVPQDVDWKSHVEKFSKAKMPHPAGGHVVLADASVTFFISEIPLQVLEDLATIDGGETIPEDFGM